VFVFARCNIVVSFNSSDCNAGFAFYLNVGVGNPAYGLRFTERLSNLVISIELI
jgi:hypothetical protein